MFTDNQNVLNCYKIQLSLLLCGPVSTTAASTITDGKLQFCIDLCRLNNMTLKDAYSLPQIQETMECFWGAIWLMQTHAIWVNKHTCYPSILDGDMFGGAPVELVHHLPG